MTKDTSRTHGSDPAAVEKPISPAPSAPASPAQTTVEMAVETTVETTDTPVEKVLDSATVDATAIDHELDSSDEYSEWEGLETTTTTTTVTTTTVTTTTSILKKRNIDTSKLTATEIKAAKAHYVFPERTDDVLQESLMRASLNAEHAMINGFPEPSIYRDDDDPLGLFDDDDDDEDYTDKKSAKKRKVKAKSKKKKKRKV